MRRHQIPCCQLESRGPPTRRRMASHLVPAPDDAWGRLLRLPPPMKFSVLLPRRPADMHTLSNGPSALHEQVARPNLVSKLEPRQTGPRGPANFDTVRRKPTRGQSLYCRVFLGVVALPILLLPMGHGFACSAYHSLESVLSR